MDLYLLRHGKAEDAGHAKSDAERRLTKRGREDIALVGAWLATQELEFDYIAASPLVRAQETAFIVAGILKAQEKLVIWDDLVPGGDTDTICHKLDETPEGHSVLLVSHEPLLSSLIGRIIAGEAGAGIVMTKGGLAKIRNFSFTSHPQGELNWLITAKQMAFIG